MFEAIMTSRRRITIPTHLRKAMALEPGAKVVFTQLRNGTTILRARAVPVPALTATLKRTGKLGAE